MMRPVMQPDPGLTIRFCSGSGAGEGFECAWLGVVFPRHSPAVRMTDRAKAAVTTSVKPRQS